SQNRFRGPLSVAAIGSAVSSLKAPLSSVCSSPPMCCRSSATGRPHARTIVHHLRFDNMANQCRLGDNHARLDRLGPLGGNAQLRYQRKCPDFGARMLIGDAREHVQMLGTPEQTGEPNDDLGPREIEVAADPPRRLVELELHLVLDASLGYQIEGD